jgi:hypothetical protein
MDFKFIAAAQFDLLKAKEKFNGFYYQSSLEKKTTEQKHEMDENPIKESNIY